MIVPGSPNALLLAQAGDPLDELGVIKNSVRFNSPDGAYLTRTPAVAGDQTKWTYSAWVKRTAFNAVEQTLLNASTSPSDQTHILIGPSGDLVFYHDPAGVVLALKASARLLRDPSMFYHIVVSFDGNNAVAEDKVKMYVNGERITSFAINTLGAFNSSLINSTLNHVIGRYSTAATYADFLLSHVAFIGGQVLAPASFGQYHPTTGQWRPKSAAALTTLAADGGVGSYFLDFSDGSAATAAALGADRSGKGNNWTPVNISVAAGAGQDWLLDTPTNNFCAWNPLVSGDSAKSNGSLDAAGTARGTMDAGTYSSYWEITANTAGVVGGVVSESGAANTVAIPNGITYGFRLAGGSLDYTANGSAWTSIATGLSGVRFPYASGAANTLNCGQRAFAFAAPSGFAALCTKSLPYPVIKPEENFAVVLNSGPNIKASAEALFPGDQYMEWIKDRANANNHQLINTVRGLAAVLQSNTSAAETAYSAPAGSSVAWVLKESAAAGFDIVTYTGNGVAGRTVAHSLGVAPGLVIVKRVDGVTDWAVYHKGMTSAAYYMLLNSTQAQISNNALWNSTAPTSDVFTVGTDIAVNTNGANYVAFVFADAKEFSKLGSYVGNGSSADGPFVHCGFRPAYVLRKRVDAVGVWHSLDTTRDPENVTDIALNPNDGSAEAVLAKIDILSNGFKIRDTASNENGSPFIYLAFAEFTFRYANAR